MSIASYTSDALSLQLPALPIGTAKQVKQPPYEYHAINDSVYIFNFNSCKLEGFNDFIKQMFDFLNKTRVPHLIIDRRRNSGGNSLTGDETGGANISTGDIISALLPNTGIRVILPWKIFYEAGSKPGDKISGTIPHISVPADKALDKALQLITGN